MNFPEMDWLVHRAWVSPAHPALIHRDQTWSYAELNAQVEKLAGQLCAAGVQPGQQVAALLPNCPTFVILIHALVRLGAVLVPLNLRLTADELRWQVEQSNSDWLVHIESTSAQAAGVGATGCRILALDDLPVPAPFAMRPFDLDAPLAIIFTSGTTGHPKGALQTFGNHFWSALASAFRLGTLPNDRWLLTIPLYHVGGLAIPIRCCLYGTSVVIPSTENFDAQALLTDMEKHTVTLVSLVPAMFQRILDTALPLPASLRLILLGGAAATPRLLNQSIERDLSVALTYGLTEAASQVATALPDEARRKPGSVGKALMFTRLSIVDAGGRELAAGEIGEIVVTGPTVMPGYFRQAGIADGLLHTGDLGYLDAEGDLWIVQRRSDLIVSGGENIYPAEIERVLLEHPSVREVCVVGVEDQIWGQRVASAVALHPGTRVEANELQEFCRQRLAGYKIPRLMRFLPELPHTASGKIQRGAVQKLWNQADE